MTVSVAEIVFQFIKTYYERMKNDPSKLSNLYSTTAEVTHINYQHEFKAEVSVLPTVKLTGTTNIEKFFKRHRDKVNNIKVILESCDFQTIDSSHSNILIVVTGELFWSNTPTYTFAQNFILSAVDHSQSIYEITNDIIKFIPDNGRKVNVSVREKEMEVSPITSTRVTTSTSFYTANLKEKYRNSANAPAYQPSSQIKKDWPINNDISKDTITNQGNKNGPGYVLYDRPITIDSSKSVSKLKEANESMKTSNNHYSVYIRGTKDVSEGNLKAVLEKKIGAVTKMTYSNSYALVDFETRQSQTEALRIKEIDINGIKVQMEKKTTKANDSTTFNSETYNTQNRQYKKHSAKKKD